MPDCLHWCKQKQTESHVSKRHCSRFHWPELTRDVLWINYLPINSCFHEPEVTFPKRLQLRVRWMNCRLVFSRNIPWVPAALLQTSGSCCCCGARICSVELASVSSVIRCQSALHRCSWKVPADGKLEGRKLECNRVSKSSAFLCWEFWHALTESKPYRFSS